MDILTILEACADAKQRVLELRRAEYARHEQSFAWDKLRRIGNAMDDIQIQIGTEHFAPESEVAA